MLETEISANYCIAIMQTNTNYENRELCFSLQDLVGKYTTERKNHT